jgi:hypothetical protein
MKNNTPVYYLHLSNILITTDKSKVLRARLNIRLYSTVCHFQAVGERRLIFNYRGINQKPRFNGYPDQASIGRFFPKLATDSVLTDILARSFMAGKRNPINNLSTSLYKTSCPHIHGSWLAPLLSHILPFWKPPSDMADRIIDCFTYFFLSKKRL